MNDTLTEEQAAAVQTFMACFQQVSSTFQLSSAQVQALEVLALCLFIAHPNQEGVRRMFAEASKTIRATSERETLPLAPVFHEAYCGHLERLADAMRRVVATPTLPANHTIQ